VRLVEEPGRAPGPACVLVVEDDPQIRRALVICLQRWGYATLEAPDGAAALDRFRESSSRLAAMLLDIMLPILDGVEVARRVLAERPGIPIVACSAILDDDLRATLRGLGVRGFLPKPFTSETLRATLLGTLDPG